MFYVAARSDHTRKVQARYEDRPLQQICPLSSPIILGESFEEEEEADETTTRFRDLQAEPVEVAVHRSCSMMTYGYCAILNS